MSWDLIGYVLLAAAANIVGGFIIFVKKNWSDRGLNVLMAVSAGLLLAITVVDLLPEVMTANTAFSPFFIIGSMAAIFLIQHYVSPHVHPGEDVHHLSRSGSTVAGLVVGMAIHTFFDGFSIVASFGLDEHLGFAVFLAVILHKIPEGVTVTSIVFSFSRSKKRAMGSAILLGSSTLAGAVLAWLLTGVYFPNESMLVIALSISAGIFLYVAGTDLLPVVRAAKDRLLPWFVVLGVTIYFILRWILEQFGAHVH